MYEVKPFEKGLLYRKCDKINVFTSPVLSVSLTLSPPQLKLINIQYFVGITGRLMPISSGQWSREKHQKDKHNRKNANSTEKGLKNTGTQDLLAARWGGHHSNNSNTWNHINTFTYFSSPLHLLDFWIHFYVKTL